MVTDYFSDRENGPRPRTKEIITETVWNGISAVVQSLIEDGSFGDSFPDQCPDGPSTIGTNFTTWQKVVLAEHPDITWPPQNSSTPRTLAILDLIEFTHAHIAKPIPGQYHSFFSHHHLSFDRVAGRAEYRQRINRLFARNELAFKLQADGRVIRLAPVVLKELLQGTIFRTGDTILDTMLELARAKFLNPDAQVRRESLEKLWDAWERLKTIEPGADKKAQVKAILDNAATEPNFRAIVEKEARELTEIGNNFLIRHSETNKPDIQSTGQVDYLFHRLFSFIWMIIEAKAKRP